MKMSTSTSLLGPGLLALATIMTVTGCAPDDPAMMAPGEPGEPELTLQSQSPTRLVQLGDEGEAQLTFLSLPIPEDLHGDPLSAADWFLSTFGSELGIDPANLEYKEAVAGGDSTAVDYVWVKDGVPLFGVEVRVLVVGDEIAAVFSKLPTDLSTVSTSPSITEDQAWDVPVEEGDGEEVSAELVLLNAGIFESRITPTLLAWKLVRKRFGDHEVRFVDAQTGEAHPFWFADIDEALDLDVQDSNGQCDPSLYTPAPSGEVAGYLSQIYNFYLSRYGLDSYDGRGSQIKAIENYRQAEHDECIARFTSSWDPNTHTINMGPFNTSLDIAAHEYAHAFIGSFTSLRGGGETSALSESLADAFASFVDTSTPWTLGEGSALGVVRNMANPSEHGHPQHMDDMLGPKEYHENSGIPSYAIYLMTEGGTVGDIEIAGIGVPRTQQLLFQLVTQALPDGSGFREASHNSWIVAMGLADAHDDSGAFTFGNCGAVINAFAAVGLGETDRDLDCWPDNLDSCPDTYNPDQTYNPSIGAASTTCGGSGPDFDGDCCEGLICVLGDCVPDDGSREGESCDSSTCAHTLICSAVGSLENKQCCARDDDYCESDADCCGNMGCMDNECQALDMGSECLGSDCLGANFCSDGMCTQG